MDKIKRKITEKQEKPSKPIKHKASVEQDRTNWQAAQTFALIATLVVVF